MVVELSPASPEELVVFHRIGQAHKPMWFMATDRRTRIRRPVIICPDCKRDSMILKHQINPDGTIIPFYTCGHPGCTFNDLITLKDWKHGTMVPWRVKQPNGRRIRKRRK